MFTIRPIGAIRAHKKPITTPKLMENSVPIKSLLENNVVEYLQKNANNYNLNCQDAKIIVKDHPVKRMIQRVLGKSEDNMPVEIKGEVSSTLFGKENITFEKFENKITYKELKDTALGNSKISDSKSFLGGIFEKLAEMKKIGLA